jgi:hypothetical protein
MKDMHHLAETESNAYPARTVRVVLPPGWQLLVAQGTEFKVELLDLEVSGHRDDFPGDSSVSSPSPRP